MKQTNYPLASTDGIFAQSNRGRIFPKLDLSEAYLQIPVDEKDAEILTINTRKGLYKFVRLPFGIKVAPAIFQPVMDFSRAYLYEISIRSRTREELDQSAGATVYTDCISAEG